VIEVLKCDTLTAVRVVWMKCEYYLTVIKMTGVIQNLRMEFHWEASWAYIAVNFSYKLALYSNFLLINCGVS